MPRELWIEVCNILKEVVTKTISKKKKCQKAKVLSEEALLIPDKRSEGKGKGETERNAYLDKKFQRIGKGKKAILSEQCKEIEKNYRMGKTRSL